MAVRGDGRREMADVLYCMAVRRLAMRRARNLVSIIVEYILGIMISDDSKNINIIYIN